MPHAVNSDKTRRPVPLQQQSFLYFIIIFI